MKKEKEELLKVNLESTIINETEKLFNAIDKKSYYYKSLCRDVKNDSKNSTQINKFILEVQNNLINYKATFASNDIEADLLIMSKLNEIIDN